MTGDSLVKKALGLKKEKKLSEALELFREAASSGKGSQFVHSNIAHIHFIQGRFDEALLSLDLAGQCGPLSSFSRRLKVQVLKKIHREDEAAEELLRMSLDEHDPETARLLAQYYLESGQAEVCETFLERYPETAKDRRLLDLKARSLEKLGRMEEAICVYRDLVSSDAKDSHAYENLLRLQMAGKKPEEVVEDLSTILSMPSRSKDKHLRHILAKKYRDAGKMRESIEQYQEALRLDPNDRFARTQLGFCLLKEKRLEEAIPLLRQSFLEDPEDMYVTNALFSALKKTGKMNEAASLVREILSEKPHLKKLLGMLRKYGGVKSGEKA